MNKITHPFTGLVLGSLHVTLVLSPFLFGSIPPNDYRLLVCDIQQLLVAVTIHSCSSSGPQYFRIIEDLITLLGFMQTSKTPRTQGETHTLVKED